VHASDWKTSHNLRDRFGAVCGPWLHAEKWTCRRRPLEGTYRTSAKGLQADLDFRLKVPLARRAMRAGQLREQRLGETGNETTVDLVHRLRLGRVRRGSSAVIADAQHRAL
jgi:hypothetical protein